MVVIITSLQGNLNSRIIKRKRAGGIHFTPANASRSVSHLENGDEEFPSELYESDGFTSEISEDGTDVTLAVPKKRRRVEEPPKLSSKTMKKKYRCTFEGCEKAYTKPTRLEEHKRSHTGERPFKCTHPGCENSYLRESHLQAHARTHRDYSERPFVCNNDECGRRFWTSTQLRIHQETHDGELKQFKCMEVGCSETFAKHNQLRSHFASTHCPPGTKSFRCEHEGCPKSFSTSQKLRAHSKTHQANRYMCTTEGCLTEPQYFQRWSLLQAHIRSIHPPTCPHVGCGKKFTSQKNFKAHLKIHEEREIQEKLEDRMDCDEFLEDSIHRGRNATDVGRDWKCDWEGCDKTFKSKKAMNVHINVNHREERKFKCDQIGCERAFGYKHLLQRHMAKIHGRHSEGSEGSAGNCEGGNGAGKKRISKESDTVEASFIEVLTGKAYKRRGDQFSATDQTIKRSKGTRKILECPWPHFSAGEDVAAKEERMHGQCEAIFHRAYDLRRHLKADHALEVEKDELAAWLS